MSKFDLVIFDCDGVLVDSEVIVCGVDVEAYGRLGYEISIQEFSKRFAGMPDEAVDAALSYEIKGPLPPNFRLDIKKAVIRKYQTDLRAIDGARELLSS